MISVIAVLSLNYSMPIAFSDSDADCDGCTTEYEPFNARLLSNFPAYLNYDVTTSSGHTIAALSLVNNSTGHLVKYSTFYIAINETDTNRELMGEWFHAPDGILKLDFVHRSNNTSDEQITVHAMRDPFLDALTAEPNDTIKIVNFPFVVNRTYNMHVEVMGVDNPRNIFVPEYAPKVDLVFSTNEISNSEGKVLIVPEFGSAVILSVITAGAIGTMVVGGRMITFRRLEG